MKEKVSSKFLSLEVVHIRKLVCIEILLYANQILINSLDP